MIEGFAAPFADRLAMGGTGGEHQATAVGHAGGQGRQDQGLGLGRQVKQAVPGQNAVEGAVRQALAHVAEPPVA
ncbi:hypothetical protein D3C75_853020 [compost metagenome]